MKLNRSLYAWFLLILLSIIWGISPMLIKKSLISLHPFEIGALRLSFAAIILLPFLAKNINKIGISVYSPQDMRNVIEYLKPNFPDVIQFPYNFLDRRFEKNQILNIFKKFNIESYARSVYLQGLLLLDKKNRGFK